ncbi:40s ribosomal protein s3-like [Lynx pardinus]|uniref:40s ribosomal protein s3-like n=1 Tax=Lynx pardinus TaxID=191816 RepID=A0A485NCY2_LYNPA|nr:40s ribosomal protein s3-like [Lynx pardinus]
MPLGEARQDKAGKLLSGGPSPPPIGEVSGKDAKRPRGVPAVAYEESWWKIPSPGAGPKQVAHGSKMVGQISKKRKFAADGIFKVELNGFLTRELTEDSHSIVEV